MTGKSKVLAYRIDEETEQNIRDSVNATEIDSFIELLRPVEANYKTVNMVKKIIVDLDRYEQVNWAKALVKMDRPIYKVIGAYLLDKNEVYKKEPEFILELVKDFSADEDWNVRQASVDMMENLVTGTDENQLNLIKMLVESDEAHLRRLALLTCKSIAKSATYEDELKAELLDVIEPLLAEEDPYVQTVSSETFNEGFMKYCTEMTLDWLREKINETDNPTVKSTVLTILASRYVEDNIEEALNIIDGMLEESDAQIKKARSSALHKLSENHHDRVSTFLEDRLHIKQAVDHWAELEADGSLNSFTI